MYKPQIKGSLEVIRIDEAKTYLIRVRKVDSAKKCVYFEDKVAKMFPHWNIISLSIPHYDVRKDEYVVKVSITKKEKEKEYENNKA